MTMWHVDDVALRRWIDRTDALPHGASVEQHVLACAQCRDRVGVAVRAEPARQLPDLDAVWTSVRDVVELPRPSWFERLLRRAGLPAHDARLVAAAPAFRGPWLMGVLVVLAFVEVAAQVAHARGQLLFLAVAPLLPCIAVAVSYDPDVEPALEQELATPYSPLRLVVLRTVAVLVVAVPVVVVVDAVSPVPAPYLWLLPAVGFVAAVLALSTWTSPLRAALAISTAWLAAVWLAQTRVLHAPFQVCYAVVAIVAGSVFLARARHLREVRPTRSAS